MDDDVPSVTLRDGAVVPQLGFGLAPGAPADAAATIGVALALGYRRFDIAPGREADMAAALAASGLPRAAVTLALGLAADTSGRDGVLAGFDAAMRRLALSQLDLLLLPAPAAAGDDCVPAWTTLVELQQQGHVRSIGVAGFGRAQLERLIAATGAAPAVNSIVLHPLAQQRDLRGYHARRAIRIASVRPLGGGAAGGVLAAPAIGVIARKHARTPAQIIIRWHLQEGLLVGPGATRPAQLAENRDVFGFALDAEDMYRIEALDRPEDGGGATA